MVENYNGFQLLQGSHDHVPEQPSYTEGYNFYLSGIIYYIYCIYYIYYILYIPVGSPIQAQRTFSMCFLGGKENKTLQALQGSMSEQEEPNW